MIFRSRPKTLNIEFRFRRYFDLSALNDGLRWQSETRDAGGFRDLAGDDGAALILLRR